MAPSVKAPGNGSFFTVVDYPFRASYRVDFRKIAPTDRYIDESVFRLPVEATMASRRDTPLERLRGSVIRYEAPLEPAADEEDWVRLGKEDSEVRDTLRVYCQAVKVFGDHTVACEWLKTPIPALSGKAPAERLDTSEGRAIVRDILAKIEQGEFT